jgi:cyclase
MLKARVIPTLLWKNFGLVKGVAFDSWRRVGPVLPAIKVYDRREVDELILLEISASLEHMAPDYEAVHDFADECFVPFTVGGGFNNIDQVQQMLRIGADKISLNSALFSSPKLANEISRRFGSQCMVASIDAKFMGVNEGYKCFSHAGTRSTGKDPVEWARELADRGAGEILLTSIDRDGTMEGYDLRLIESVVKAVNIPVIASGGAGCYGHLCEAIQLAGASAVAAASMFHFTEQTPAEAKKALAAVGVPVRSAFTGF